MFEAIQTINRNMVNTMQMQIEARWASRESHLILLNAPTLRRTQQMTENTLNALSALMVKGETEQVIANSHELEAITGAGSADRQRSAAGDHRDLRLCLAESGAGASAGAHDRPGASGA